jgi:hypothetical protein
LDALPSACAGFGMSVAAKRGISLAAKKDPRGGLRPGVWWAQKGITETRLLADRRGSSREGALALPISRRAAGRPDWQKPHTAELHTLTLLFRTGAGRSGAVGVNAGPSG